MRYGFILFETNTYAYISMFYSFQIFQETVRCVKGILMEILTQKEKWQAFQTQYTWNENFITTEAT